MASIQVRSQTYTILHDFAPEGVDPATSEVTNADGDLPRAHLTVSGSTIYGVTSGGCSNGIGGVFRLNTDGSNFTNLFNFSLNDGALAMGGLLLVSNTLYGTCQGGGANLKGTIFAVQTDGTGFTKLHTFSAAVSNINADGAGPDGTLALVGNTLYGVTSSGGTHGYGTVFGISTDGTGFTNLHYFQQTDGASPKCDLVASGDMLYGTTMDGGAGDNTNGTIFAVETNGSGFSTFHSFSLIPALPSLQTNYDGKNPSGGLVFTGGTLYGATTTGGLSGYGTIYAINTDGTGFQPIYSFVKPDGIHPNSDLVVIGGVIYGTTQNGSTSSGIGGTVFSVNTNGTDYVTLIQHSIGSTNGAAPVAGLTYSGGVFYGVDAQGGANGAGVVFSVNLGGAAPQPIPLNIQFSGGTPVLSWSGSSFVLQATQNLSAGFTNVPGATSPFTVTTTNSPQFFRLVGN